MGLITKRLRLCVHVPKDDPDAGASGDESDDAYLAFEERAQQRQHLVDVGDQHSTQICVDRLSRTG